MIMLSRVKRKSVPFVIAVIFLIILFTLAFLFVGATEDQRGGHSAMMRSVSRCLERDGERDACLASLCEHEVGYLCAEHVVDMATKVGGPEAGMDALRQILEGPVFGIDSNGHQLAHIVGRASSLHWGFSGDVFNRCPIDFDYGCLHGFFEIAMTKVDSPTDVLVSICENASNGPKFDKVNCYHGGGHGVMMNESYNLDKALSVCDSLPADFMRRDCWGGVFMENNNRFRNGLVADEQSTFRSDNPRAPCDSVADKYRHSCWILHADYLINAYSTSLDDLIDVCLGAGDYVEGCLHGVARIFSAERQDVILRGSDIEIEGDFVDRTFQLCDKFPDDYVQSCHFFVVEHFIFPYKLRTGFDQAHKYCMLVDSDRGECFERIGIRLSDLMDDDARVAMCEAVPPEWRDRCSDAR